MTLAARLSNLPAGAHHGLGFFCPPLMCNQTGTQ